MKHPKSVAVVAVATFGLIGGVAACDGGSTEKAGQTVTDQREKNDPSHHTDDPFNDGAKDVTIKSCSIGDPYSLGDRVPVVDLAIKNNSSKVSDYFVEVEVTDTATGDRVEMMLASATAVGPGQTVDTGSGDGEEDPVSGKSQIDAQSVKCQVVSADRTPTP